jgi:hypothetical protein
VAISKEGQNLAWVRPNKLRDYPMPAADIPLIPHLIDLLRQPSTGSSFAIFPRFGITLG